MYNDVVTSDFAKFGEYGRDKVIAILQAWERNGLPNDFDNSNVHFAFNTRSGFVFITNDEYQAAMINPVSSKLEVWYSTPYGGHEGFLTDLMKLRVGTIHPEDVEYILDLIEGNIDPDTLSEVWKNIWKERYPN